jgi:hypothetical protein
MSEPKIRFKGDHNPDGSATEFHEGIPARHLTDEDYDALPKELREVVRNSPLYDYAGYKEAKDAVKSEEKAEEKAEEPKAEAKVEEKPAAHTRAKEAK